MPTIETLTINPNQARKGDKIVALPLELVKGGKRVVADMLAGQLLVQKVEWKTTNVVVTLDTEDNLSFTIQQAAEIEVRRSVQTDEEKAADRKRWMEQQVRRSIDKHVGRPLAMMADFSGKLGKAEQVGWFPRDAVEFGFELAKATELENLCLSVVALALGDEESEREPMDLLEAYKVIAGNATRRLVQNIQRPDSRSTSTASNMVDDAANAARAIFIDRDFGLWD